MTATQPKPRPAVVNIPARTPCPVCARGGHVVITPRGEVHPAQAARGGAR